MLKKVALFFFIEKDIEKPAKNTRILFLTRCLQFKYFLLIHFFISNVMILFFAVKIKTCLLIYRELRKKKSTHNSQR